MRPKTPTRFPYLLAFLSGGVLSLMVLFNGQMAAHSTPLFASLAAHGLGLIAAAGLIGALVGIGRMAARSIARPAPVWAWMGGLSGAATVMLTSFTTNSALALSGTLALGLVGQVAFGMATDRFGWFGLAHRRPGLRDLGALALILAGSGLIIFVGRG